MTACDIIGLSNGTTGIGLAHSGPRVSTLAELTIWQSLGTAAVTALLLAVGMVLASKPLRQSGLPGRLSRRWFDRTDPIAAPGPERRGHVDAAVLAGKLFGARLMLLACAALSLLVVVAWLTNWTNAQSLVPGLPTMKCNTALGLLLVSIAGLGVTVLPKQTPRRSIRAWPLVASAFAFAAIVLSAASLIQTALGVNLGIDTFLCQDPASVATGQLPGRMSQPTAGAMLLLSLATLGSLAGRTRLTQWSIWLSGSIGVGAVLLFFLRGWDVRQASVFSGVAIHTAILITAMATGLYSGHFARRRIIAADLGAAVRAERPRALQSLGLVATTMVLGIIATSVIVADSHRVLIQSASSDFDRLRERILSETARRVNQPVYGMKGARGAFAASENVTRDEFKAYVDSRDLPAEFPGAIGMGIIDRVQREDVETYVEAQRAEGASDFGVRVLAPEGSPLATLPDLYIIKQCYPQSRNAQAWGLDVGSESVRRTSIERAISTGEPTISGKITLVQQHVEHAGFLYYVPVYENGLPTTTPEERRDALDCIIYAPIVLEESMVGILESADHALDLAIYDGPTLEEHTLLFATDGPAPRNPQFSSVNLIGVGGHTWTVVTASTPRFDASIDTASLGMIAASGVLLSGLIAGFVAVTQTSRSRAVAIAVSMTSDLAEAKERAEHALREVHDLQLTLDSHTLVSVTDPKGRFLSVNRQFCLACGYREDELLGRDYRVLQSDICPASFWDHVWFTLDAGEAWRGEVCHRARDGSTFWVDTVIMPFRDQHGQIEKHVILSSDITSRKLVERELRESSDRLNLAAQVAEIGVWEWCIDTDEVHWDKTMFQLYGITPSPDGSLRYAAWADTILAEDLPEQERILKNTAATGGRSEREFRMRRLDGEIRTIQAAEIAVVGPDGHCERVIGVNKDITEDRAAEDRERAAAEVISRQNAELANLADRAHRVVDDVSHEFRTPLAVIKEFASIISDGLAGPVSDQQAEYLQIMDGSVIDLNHMVEDLLDSSKLRSGRLRVEREPVTVDNLFARDHEGFARKASLRSLVIEEDIEAGLPDAFADGEKVRRVIANLMTNAIKFSRQGGRIRLAAAQTTPGEITISVTDNGAGLSEDDIDRLFGRFSQVSTARSVAAKGFGLGLSIAQELAWLNLGTLSVTSEKGKGASFYFTLPTNSPESVLSHYFDALRASERPSDRLALLKVTRDGPHREGQDPDEPLAFLGSVAFPTDLILTSPWPGREPASDPTSRTWWMLGGTCNPQSWLVRIEEARRETIEDESLNLSPLRVDLAQTWDYPGGASDAHAEVLDRIGRGVAHGSQRADH